MIHRNTSHIFSHVILNLSVFLIPSGYQDSIIRVATWFITLVDTVRAKKGLNNYTPGLS